MKRVLITVSAIALLSAGAAHALPVVHNSDFIADGSRSHFNGFEQIPNDGTFFTGGAGPYLEDTIAVAQVSGDPPNDIWVTYNFPGVQGQFEWYPNGGDFGYTVISLAGGVDFEDVGFNFGSGGGPQSVLYELLDNNVFVLAGSASLSTSGVNYLGFSGGGFDTIALRDTFSGVGGTVTDGSFQALAIDNIETQGSGVPSVPEPASLVLVGAALVGATVSRRRTRKV